MTAPLDGLRVIEFGDGVSVSYCGALFAAAGADVVAIEPPVTGRLTRSLSPLDPNMPPIEASGLHRFLFANKKSIAVDLDDPSARDKLMDLVRDTDLILEAMGPGYLDDLGLGYADMKSINPRLVYHALSWFGSEGPRRDWQASDAVIQALSGFIYPIGPKEGPPIIPSGYNAQISAGITAYIAALAAVMGAARQGIGSIIDHSILEAQTTYTETAGVRFSYDGLASERQAVNRFTPTYPQTIYAASDGWIGVTALTPAQWPACCRLIGAPDLADDPRFDSAKKRSDRSEELDPILAPYFAKRPALEWFHEGQAAKIPFALVSTVDDFKTLDHFVERGVLGPFHHPDGPAFSAPVIPWKLPSSPLHQGGTAPRLGADQQLLENVPISKTSRAETQEAEKDGGLPLASYRIIDFTMGWAGPLATRHMADLGAEVIKIEACQHPDWWRGWDLSPNALANQDYERNPPFNQVNRNKLGVTLDLTRPAGRDLALKLVADADAVIENQATGVMAKLGLSYEELCKVNPNIVMVSLPGFGAEGPWSGYRGYGSTVEHASGLPYFSGEEGGPPLQTHIAYGDACGGLNAAAALLSALYYRDRSGQGQRVDISQVEGLLQLGVHGHIAPAVTGSPLPRQGSAHYHYAPQGVYRCQGQDQWLVITILDNGAWQSLCDILDRRDWAADPELHEIEGRRAKAADIDAAISNWSRDQDADQAMVQLQSVGVAAGLVRQPSDLLTDDCFQTRGFWQTIARDVVGEKPHPLASWYLNGERLAIRHPAPTLGEHNAYVLSEILGLSDKEIAALSDDQIIGHTPTAAM